MRRISSHLLLTPSGLLPDRVVTVADDGRIVDISTSPHLDREPGTEFFPGVLVPGFFNAHCHLELSHLRGTIPPGGGFTAFARGMSTARSVGPGADAARFWDAKMWSEGVSAVADICNGSTTFDLKTRSRIKYRNRCELFGLHADPAPLFALRNKAVAAGLDATVTPHSTYSLNRENFAAAVSDDDTRPLSIHFMESDEEVDLFRRKGPLWDWYVARCFAPDFLDYGSPAERLTAQVPPDKPVTLVHNCVVTQRDIDTVMGHFTAPVTWVLCPGSNRYISGLVPPVELLRKNRLKIAVGTDSLASNDVLSMVGELRLIKNVPLAELLGWAAADTVEPGRTPGLVLLTGVDFEKMTLTASSRAQRII